MTDERPRLWPTFLVLALLLPALIASSLVLLVVAWIAGEDMDEVELFFAQPGWFALALVVTQGTYLLLAVIPAVLSRRGWSARLGLVRPKGGAVPLVCAVFGTLFVTQMATILWSLLFDEPSDHLQQLVSTFTDAPLLVGVCLALLASVVPGFVEEVLMRGYVQSRLLLRWHPALAIVFTSVVFACLHMDPQHVLGVLPLALWLGYVAWRGSSTWTSILCHAFNNAFALGMVVLGVDVIEELNWTFTLGMASVSFLPFVAAIAMFERGGEA